MPGRAVSRVGGAAPNAGLRIKLAGCDQERGSHDDRRYFWQRPVADSYGQPARAQGSAHSWQRPDHSHGGWTGFFWESAVARPQPTVTVASAGPPTLPPPLPLPPGQHGPGGHYQQQQPLVQRQWQHDPAIAAEQLYLSPEAALLMQRREQGLVGAGAPLPQQQQYHPQQQRWQHPALQRRLAEADMDLGTPPPPLPRQQRRQAAPAAPQAAAVQQQHRPPVVQRPPVTPPQVLAPANTKLPRPACPWEQQKQQPAASAPLPIPPAAAKAAPARLAATPSPPLPDSTPPPLPAATPLPPLPDGTPPPSLSTATPELPASTRPPLPAPTPAPPLPESTPPPLSAAPPPLPATTPPPLPLDTPPATEAAAAAPPSPAAGASSPVVPDFIQQLWQQRQEQEQEGHDQEQAVAAQGAASPVAAQGAASPAAGSASLPAGKPPASHASAVRAAPADKTAVAAAAGHSSSKPEGVQQQQKSTEEEEKEEGEIAGQVLETGGHTSTAAAAAAASTTAAPPLPLPPGLGRTSGSAPARHPSSSSSSESESGRSSRAQQLRRHSSRERRRSHSRGQQSSRGSYRSRRRERSFSSSSRSRSRGRRDKSTSSSDSEYDSRRHAPRRHAQRRQHPGRRYGSSSRRRRSRSPLRRVGRSDVVSKRRPAYSAGPGGPREAQLTLVSLVESMSAEAARLQHQLGRMGAADGPGSTSGSKDASSSSSKGADSAQPSSSSAADVERQLAALSSKLGQLSLCLESMQQQPQGLAAVWEAEPSSTSTRSEHAGVMYVVFDTNVWMDDVDVIRECWKALVASGCTTLRFLVPLAVLSELDGLKKCLFRGWWARRAIHKLAKMQGHQALRGQREDELYRRQLRRNDDGILDCMLHFRALGAQVEFVTKDGMLALRARNEGFLACGSKEARQRLLQRVQKETGKAAK